MDQNLFGGAPRFLTRPKAFSVCVGKDATLSCTIVGSPTPLITWEKDKLKLTSGGRFKTVEDGDVYRLTIYDLTLEDSGQYMCRAKNSVGEAYAAVTLKVGLPTEMSQKAPVFMVKPASARVVLGGDVILSYFLVPEPKVPFRRKLQDVEVQEKTSATLMCEVKTEVKWYKDGKLLISSRTIYSEAKGNTRQLVIEKAEKSDAGEYTCEAGGDKLVFKIFVTAPCFGLWL
uniref:Obscurin, cytoskeletal calmodulin and titin-interacting RhoGEF b n=1 Tax=Neolamprologus brichardi TaxID=32507 RepID=A0A3Q4HD81_NEOBR